MKDTERLNTTALPPFTDPEPRVKLNSDTLRWRCPRCKRRNAEGDTTCVHCGQDVEVLA